MNATTRMGAIYVAAFAGAGLVSWLRGRSGRDMIVDTVLHGAVAGTALNVVGYMVLPSGEAVPVVARPNGGLMALLNGGKTAALGKLGKKGVELLSQIDGDTLFSAMKSNGVKVAEVPENESMITPDAL